MADFGSTVARGEFRGRHVVQALGFNPAVGTSVEAISEGGLYRMPVPASATTLRVKIGGNAGDTAAGVGAQAILLEGLDATGAYITDTLVTAGASVSSASSLSFMRLLRASVSASGTHGDVAADSHVAAIVIENGAGGTDWATIAILPSPQSQTQIGAYSVPLGKTAYLHGLSVEVEHADTSTPTDVGLYTRNNILEAAAPFSPFQSLLNFGGMTDTVNMRFENPIQFNALTDILFMALAAAGAPKVFAGFELSLVDS